MNSSSGVASGAHFMQAARSYCRRIVAMITLAACVFVAPAIASIAQTSLHRVRLARIDTRPIEGLQRWANDEDEAWREEA
jgi:hypothetical protein